MYNQPQTGIAGWLYIPLALVAIIVFLIKKTITFVKKMNQ